MGGRTVGGGDYCKEHAGINATAPTTTSSNHTKGVQESVTDFMANPGDFLESPRGTVIRIEFLVVLAALALLLLATFGSRRRRSRSWLIQNVVLAAFALSPSLVTYTLGSMQSSAVKSIIMYPIWTMSLFILPGCADSITAYSLHDNKQATRMIMYQFLLNYIYVLVFIASSKCISRGSVSVCLFLLFPAYFKFFHRIAAFQVASNSWNLNKMVADYMYEEHTMTNGGQAPWDPVSMKGYRYPVDWPLRGSIAEEIRKDGPEVIDIEKVWGCPDKTVLSPELKDACLSFSLFHLLRRRFFGFACGESTLQKTHDFVFKGLLLPVPENEEGTVDYNRVFKVIEVELAFMYDFFFTKYAAIYYEPWIPTVMSMVSPILIAVAVFLVATDRVFSTSNCTQDAGSVPLNTTAADVVITVSILACTACLELLQLLFYWTSIWGRVSFVCQYLRRGSSCIMRCRELLTKIGVNCASREHYWQHKLGQYTLLDSVRYNPERRIPKWEHKWEHPINGLIGLNGRARRRVAGKPAAVGLPAKVKEALVKSLVRTDGKLTDGESSLLSNGADDLLWACAQDMRSSDTSCCCSQKLENRAHHILTWHIATCYCEMAMAKLRCFCPNEGTDLKLHVEVATKLSKYCAYLVVSAPRLLPGHHYDTSCVFDEVAREARRHLQHEEDKYEAMKDLPLPDMQHDTTTFHRGVKLGKQLEEMEDATLRWKVLADFWAELMFYVAPSDNAKDHVEQLAQGGEFITHLWALLFHAGIVNQHDTVVVEHVNQHDTVVVEHVNQHDTVVVELVDGDRSSCVNPATVGDPRRVVSW